jgi:hypothetical protein
VHLRVARPDLRRFLVGGVGTIEMLHHSIVIKCGVMAESAPLREMRVSRELLRVVDPGRLRERLLSLRERLVILTLIERDEAPYVSSSLVRREVQAAGFLLRDQPRGWLALERIYAAGKALDPEDAEIEISRAITADECASCVGDRPDLVRRLILAGRAAAARAIELRPSDARAHYALGMVDYSFRHGSIESALACYRYALQPTLARYQLLKELTAAAEGPLHAELSDGLAQLRRASAMTSTADESEDE